LSFVGTTNASTKSQVVNASHVVFLVTGIDTLIRKD